MRHVLDRSVLEERLAACRTVKQQRLQEHRQLKAAMTENAAQLNVLIGRETELEELLALPGEPPSVEPA